MRPTVAGLLDLSQALGATEDMDGSLDALRRAAEMDPSSAETFSRLGAALRWSGQVEVAVVAYRRAVTLDPGHAAAQSGLAYTLLFDDATPAAEAFGEHVEWGRRFADDVERLPALGNDGGLVDALVGAGDPGLRRTSDPASGRRLRVGYVSNNFRDSAVMPFVRPILAHPRPGGGGGDLLLGHAEPGRGDGRRPAAGVAVAADGAPVGRNSWPSRFGPTGSTCWSS